MNFNIIKLMYKELNYAIRILIALVSLAEK